MLNPFPVPSSPFPVSVRKVEIGACNGLIKSVYFYLDNENGVINYA